MSQHWTRKKSRSREQPEPLAVERFVEQGATVGHGGDPVPVVEDPGVPGDPQNQDPESPSIPVSQATRSQDDQATSIPVNPDTEIPGAQAPQEPEPETLDANKPSDDVLAHSAGTLVRRAKTGDKKKVSAYLDLDLAAQLRRHCFDTNTDISDVIVVALEKHLVEPNS